MSSVDPILPEGEIIHGHGETIGGAALDLLVKQTGLKGTFVDVLRL